MPTSNLGKPKPDQQPESQEGSVRCQSCQDEIAKSEDSTHDHIANGDTKIIENGGCEHQTHHINQDEKSIETTDLKSEEAGTDVQYISSTVEHDNKAKLVDLAAEADSKPNSCSDDVDIVHPVFSEPEPTANDTHLDSTESNIGSTCYE